MKKTTTKQNKQDVKPKTVALREVVPWFLVAIMTFAVAGVVAGWTFRSHTIAETTNAVALTSKEQAR